MATATSTVTAPFTVTASSVLDPVNLSNTAQTVNEDATINVGAQFAIGLVDLDGSQSLSYTISGIPAGYAVTRALTGATAYTDLGGGSVRFSGPNAADVITSIRTMVLDPNPGAAHRDANFTLSIAATTVEVGGATDNGAATHAVTVRAVADAPTNGAPAPPSARTPARPSPSRSPSPSPTPTARRRCARSTSSSPPP